MTPGVETYILVDVVEKRELAEIDMWSGLLPPIT
jgi:hypothetical protein